ITHSKQAEQSLRDLADTLEKRVAERTAALEQSEDFIRSALETAAEGIVTIDDHGVITAFNKAAEQMFGYKAKQALNQAVNTLLPANKKMPESELAGFLSSAEVEDVLGVRRELMARRKDGTEFPVDVAVSRASAQGRNFYTGIIRDISERRSLENQVLVIAS